LTVDAIKTLAERCWAITNVEKGDRTTEMNGEIMIAMLGCVSIDELCQRNAYPLTAKNEVFSGYVNKLSYYFKPLTKPLEIAGTEDKKAEDGTVIEIGMKMKIHHFIKFYIKRSKFCAKSAATIMIPNWFAVTCSIQR
jgi:hypothetical protein